MNSKPNESQNNILKTIGVERPKDSVAESIAIENILYIKPVFIPVFALTFYMCMVHFSIPVALAFILQTATFCFLLFNYQRGKKTDNVRRTNAMIYLHMLGILIFCVMCAIQAPSVDLVWYYCFITIFTLFSIFVVPPTYSVLFLFVLAVILIVLFPNSIFSMIPARRLISVIASIIYLTALRFFRNSSSVMAYEQVRMEKLLLEQQAERDSQTGVYNRRGADRVISEYIQSSPGKPACLVELEIKDLKLFNSLYGLEVGNVLIKTVVREIGSVFGQDVVVIRATGDTFAVFIKDFNAEEGIPGIHQYAATRHSLTHEGNSFDYEITVGYATYPAQGETAVDLFNKADQAVFHANANNLKCVAFEPKMLRQSELQLGFTELDLATGIPGALLIYKADGDQQILFANDELVHIFECDDLADLQSYLGNSFRNLVHPQDAWKVQASISKQLANGNSNLDYVEYRIITKNGKVKNIVDYGKLVHSQHHGDIFYVFLYDEQKRAELQALPHTGPVEGA